MKKAILGVSSAALLILSGCGSSDETTATTAAAMTTEITVERGPVLGATVRDANGQMGVSKGGGVYSFINPVYPLESFGGYIDIDRDGAISAGDVAMGTLRLRTQAGSVMTMATTMSQNSELYAELLDEGFTQVELLEARPSLDIDNAALSDEVYAYCFENNISDPALLSDTDMLTLRARIQTRKATYNDSGLDAATLEAQLMDDLGVSGVSEEELTEIAATTPVETMINAITPTALTPEQKATLAYMWDEERLAHDLYLALHALTPSNTFYNIATKSESQHTESVRALIEKYDLNIFNTTDFSGGYDAEALAAYEDGIYNTPEITTLYSELYAKGENSLQDALQAGCMVEVTDVDDLTRDIALVANAEDLVLVFESLRSGSYNHYWAFDKALKAQGVATGCCSLGEAFCKTTEEYPQNDKMGGKH